MSRLSTGRSLLGVAAAVLLALAPATTAFAEDSLVVPDAAVFVDAVPAPEPVVVVTPTPAPSPADTPVAAPAEQVVVETSPVPVVATPAPAVESVPVVSPTAVVAPVPAPESAQVTAAVVVPTVVDPIPTEGTSLYPHYPSCTVADFSVTGSYTGVREVSAVLQKLQADGSYVTVDTDLTLTSLPDGISMSTPIPFGESAGYRSQVLTSTGTLVMEAVYTVPRPTSVECGSTPPVIGVDQTVLAVPVCKGLSVTNRYTEAVTVTYGDFAATSDDGSIVVDPGQTARIDTTRTSLDYVAYTVTTDLLAGSNAKIVIDQNCTIVPPDVCQADLAGLTATYAVTNGVVVYTATLPMNACADTSTINGDAYQVPPTYVGSGEFNPSATPQHYFPETTADLVIKSGTNTVTVQRKLPVICWWIQVDIYVGEKVILVTPSGHTGFIAGGLVQLSDKKCDMTPPVVPPVVPSVTPPVITPVVTPVVPAVVAPVAKTVKNHSVATDKVLASTGFDPMALVIPAGLSCLVGAGLLITASRRKRAQIVK